MAVRQRTSRGYFFNVALLTFAAQAAPVGSWQAEVSDAPELDAGFRLLYEMKPADARAKFAAWQTSHPQDPLGSAAEAASYLFEECYRQGVLTSEFFLDDRRFLGKIAIKPDQEVRDAFFAAELRAQDRRRKDRPQQLMSNLADGFLCPPPVELLGATVPICDDVVHATHENAVVREIEEARLLNAELLRTGRWDGELVHTKADGTEVVMASRWSLQRDDRQRPLAILELDSDITERKRAEEKLRQSEAYLSEAQRLSHTGSFSWQVSTDATIWSEETFRIFQYDRTAKPSVELVLQRVHPEDADFVTQTIERASQEGKDYDFEYRLLMPDGSVKHLHVVARAARGKSGELEFVGAVMDITTVKEAESKIQRAEEALRQAQAELAHVSRVTTMGELTATLAHEVNQPLSAVVANGNACLRWLLTDPPNLSKAHEAAERIIRDGKDAGEIVRRVRALFKRTSGEKVALDLNGVIGEVLRLLRGDAARRRIIVETDLDQDLPSVAGDRIQLQQVVLNLVLNGIEAMDPIADRPKKLFIRTARESGDAAIVEIRDHGVGIENPAKAFEAFFTTKETGIGMGLAICRSIIDAHHGRLWVASRDGPGATVCFTIPLQSSGAQ